MIEQFISVGSAIYNSETTLAVVYWMNVLEVSLFSGFGLNYLIRKKKRKENIHFEKWGITDNTLPTHTLKTFYLLRGL